jgi:hypothetical protein
VLGSRRTALRHRAHHASTNARKAALTRRERAAPGPSHAHATLRAASKAAGPCRGPVAPSRGACHKHGWANRGCCAALGERAGAAARQDEGRGAVCQGQADAPLRGEGGAEPGAGAPGLRRGGHDEAVSHTCWGRGQRAPRRATPWPWAMPAGEGGGRGRLKHHGCAELDGATRRDRAGRAEMGVRGREGAAPRRGRDVGAARRAPDRAPPRGPGGEAAPGRGRARRAGPGHHGRASAREREGAMPSQGRRRGRQGRGERGLTARGRGRQRGRGSERRVDGWKETTCARERETCVRVGRGEREREAVSGRGGTDGWAPLGGGSGGATVRALPKG